MLYLHIPYCHHKCTYCGFYSVAGRRDMEAYVDSLCRELEMRRDDECHRSVYLGGGTPSLLSANQLQRIVNAVRDNYDLSLLEEVTIEANPEDLSQKYLDDLASLGFFNRLSIGIQSFDDAELHLLNRVHNGQMAEDAINNAARAGFGNISVDLIMGLPGQGAEHWRRNLERLSGLASFGSVRHLSCYELTVEEGSILARQLSMGRVALPDEEVVAAQWETLSDWTVRNGLEQYEVSNYCRPGYHSRHNSGYWNRTPYLGFGPGAHSFDGTRRRWNLADVGLYADSLRQGLLPPSEEERLTDKDCYNEYVMTALRTTAGISKGMVAEQYRRHLERGIRPFVDNGLIVEDCSAYRPTREGLLHADGIAERLFVG